MATRTLVKGSTDWGATASWSGTTVPVDGDSVAAYDSGANITGTLNQSAIQLTDLTFSEGFTGDVGGGGTSLQIDVNYTGGTKTLVWAGRGRLYWTGMASTVKVQNGEVHITGGTVTNLYVEANATVYIDDNAVVTNIYTTGSGAPAVYAEYNATGFTTADIGAGTLVSKRNIATGTANDGATISTTDTAAVSTKMNVRGGGRFNHKASGIVANIEVWSKGSFDRMGANYSCSVTDSTFHSGANVHPHWIGVTTNINGSGGTNASTIIGLKDGGLETI